MDVRAYATTMAAYNRWVNAQVLAAAGARSDEERRRIVGGAFGSVHATLEHLVLGDQLWLQRFGHQPLTAHEGRERLSDFAVLRAEREATDADIEQWASGLTEAFGDAPFQFTSLAYGCQRSVPGWVAVTHLFNHQTHHRGQLMTLLRQLGHAEPFRADLPFMPTFD